MRKSFKVNGIDCANCAAKLERGIAKIKGVESCAVVFATSKLVLEGRDSIYNTGYFYDIYPTFEQVPEGVIVTYHVLENPVLTEIGFSGNTVEKTEDLNKMLTVKTGEILNSRRLHDNVQAVQERY